MVERGQGHPAAYLFMKQMKSATLSTGAMLHAGRFAVDSGGGSVALGGHLTDGGMKKAAGAESLNASALGAENPCEGATVSPTSRCGGIGRRDGFKIRSG